VSHHPWGIDLPIFTWYPKCNLCCRFIWSIFQKFFKYFTFGLKYWRSLLPQVNGWKCVDFKCTNNPVDGLFWSLPILDLLGLFSKHECWITDLIMFLYHFIFCVVTCLFVSQGFISIWNVKTINMTNFQNKICLINIQVINFKFCLSY
jgi:hypothetical protein